MTRYAERCVWDGFGDGGGVVYRVAMLRRVLRNQADLVAGLGLGGIVGSLCGAEEVGE